MTNPIRSVSLLLAGALVAAACGGTAETSTTVPGAPSSSTSSSSTVAPVTSAAVTTTLAAPSLAPLEIERLDSGLPATFVAVTEEWEAVEVDTATGDIIRSIGRLEAASESDQEAGLFNAIQSVWRTSDGASYTVSTCCEPAAGAIYFVPPDGTLNASTVGELPLLAGWTAAPSPYDGRVATLGLSIDVYEDASDLQASVLPDPLAGMASGTVAWHNNGRQLSWLASGPDGWSLSSLDLDDLESGPDIVAIDWVAEGQWLQGLGIQESGRLVGFLTTQTDDAEAPQLVSTEGVVFDEFGLIATFDVELGSFWGSYDPSGNVLIYIDGDNVVRWQGLGRSGVLADGFIHASW